MSAPVTNDGYGGVSTVGRLLLMQDDLIQEADEAFCRLFGFTPHALTGIRFESILTRASQILYQLHFSPSLRLNGKVEEGRFTLKSGRAETVKIVVAAIAIQEGNEACYELLICQDR
ncbi:sigma-B regulation protein RsbU (phosphoserine phosphatase) [Cohnella sp. OV330]|nr:sigma-B regulation protein RsbU (phosphoserine phosphatase) [Cohnella sp. OV330]